MCKERMKVHQHSWFSFHTCHTSIHSSYSQVLTYTSSCASQLTQDGSASDLRCERESRGPSPHWEPRSSFSSKVQSNKETGPGPSSHVEEKWHGWIPQDRFISSPSYFALCHIDGLMQTGTRLCSNVLSLKPLTDLASRALLVKSSTAISRGYSKWALLQTINNLGQRAGKITEDHYISQAVR